MKVILLAYNEPGAAGLDFLIACREEIAAVVTHRDDPGENIWFRSVAAIGRNAGVPVHLAEETDLDALTASIQPDLILSIFYRHLVPMKTLRRARRGGLNLHPSLLPKYRGRAIINWVLVNGERETGVTLHHMAARADAGDIVARRRIAIDPRETALTLARKTAGESRRLLEEAWPLICEERAPRTPQDESQATVMPGRRPEDGRIDWTLPAERVDGLVRAVTRPWPGAFTEHSGRRIMVWAGVPAGGSGRPGEVLPGGIVACGSGAFRVAESDPLPQPGTLLGG